MKNRSSAGSSASWLVSLALALGIAAPGCDSGQSEAGGPARIEITRDAQGKAEVLTPISTGMLAIREKQSKADKNPHWDPGKLTVLLEKAASAGIDEVYVFSGMPVDVAVPTRIIPFNRAAQRTYGLSVEQIRAHMDGGVPEEYRGYGFLELLGEEAREMVVGWLSERGVAEGFSENTLYEFWPTAWGMPGTGTRARNELVFEHWTGGRVISGIVYK